MIGFASGQTLFIKGDHDFVESWKLDLLPLSQIDPERVWMVIPTTGGNIATFAPSEFDPTFDADEPANHLEA